MNEYVRQSDLLGDKPVVANHLNIPKPPAGQPTLLTADEVRTAFHEFGHGLHGMFSHVKYPRFSGTSVPRDFVEFPSQFNEMWAVYPEVVKNFAKHYQTGETIPQELMDKMLAAGKFNQGYATTEYLVGVPARPGVAPAFARPGADRRAGLRGGGAQEGGGGLRAGAAALPQPVFLAQLRRGILGRVLFVFLERGAGGGREKWVLDHGGLTRANGDHIRQTLLSRGGTAEALSLFKEFSGHAPDVHPLLKRRGLE